MVSRELVSGREDHRMSRPGLCKSVKNPVLPSSQSLLAFTPEEWKNNKRQQEKKSSLDLRTERQVSCPQVLTLCWKLRSGRGLSVQWLAPPQSSSPHRRVPGMCPDNWTPTKNLVTSARDPDTEEARRRKKLHQCRK